MEITLWSRCFSSISGIGLDSRAHFRSESVQRFIYFIKLNTLSTVEEFVSFKGKYSFMYLNWTYPYDSDVFLHFMDLIRILEPNSVSNQSRDSFILIKLNTLSTGEELLTSRGNRVLSILIGDNFMKQMFFFNFGYWVGF